MARVGPLADPQVQEALNKRADEDERLAEGDLRSVMQTPAGRRVLWRLVFNRSRKAIRQDSNVNQTIDAALHNEAVANLEEVMRVAPEEYWMASREAEARHKEHVAFLANPLKHSKRSATAGDEERDG